MSKSVEIIKCLFGDEYKAVQIKEGEKFRLCGLKDGKTSPTCFIRDGVDEDVPVFETIGDKTA